MKTEYRSNRNGPSVREASALRRSQGARTQTKGESLTQQKADPNKIRLNKYLADCGVASRRRADELVILGHVKINGHKVFELGVKVDPRTDSVTVLGEPVKQTEEKVYFMFFKPKNVVTTMSDPEGRPCIADYLKGIPERVFPVGRLDWETEGMILLTNDGEFANQVMHPSHEITKTYLVKLNGHLDPEQIARLKDGISIIGGRVSAKSVQKVRRGADLYGWYRVVITEGKNRQIHKMFEKIGFDVLKLQRVAIGTLELSALDRGEMRPLLPSVLRKVFIPEEEPTASRMRLSTEKPRGASWGVDETPRTQGPRGKSFGHVRRNGKTRW